MRQIDQLARELADVSFTDPNSDTTLRLGDQRDPAQLSHAADQTDAAPRGERPILTATCTKSG